MYWLRVLLPTVQYYDIWVLFSDDTTGSDKDVERPASTIHKVPSFGDRLRNMILQRNIESDVDVISDNSATSCRRCSQV